jgi:hypothetical protein
MARWRSGNAGVCKTPMRRFNSGTRLQFGIIDDLNNVGPSYTVNKTINIIRERMVWDGIARDTLVGSIVGKETQVSVPEG